MKNIKQSIASRLIETSINTIAPIVIFSVHTCGPFRFVLYATSRRADFASTAPLAYPNSMYLVVMFNYQSFASGKEWP